MRLDQYGNPIYQDADVFKLIYNGILEPLHNCIIDNTDDLIKLKALANLRSTLVSEYDYSIPLAEFDDKNQQEWLIPVEYKNFNIDQYCMSLCATPLERNRVIEELDAFNSRRMIPLLQALKYLVDTLRANNIVWGVGRGSSVASYVLFLLGIHKIDSLKYNLDWREFLR